MADDNDGDLDIYELIDDDASILHRNDGSGVFYKHSSFGGALLDRRRANCVAFGDVSTQGLGRGDRRPSVLSRFAAAEPLSRC